MINTLDSHNPLTADRFDAEMDVKAEGVFVTFTKQKTQAYDLTPKTKEAILKICKSEQRSESFIVSRILNKMFDPISDKK